MTTSKNTEVMTTENTDLMPLEKLAGLTGRKAFDMYSDIDQLRPYINMIRTEALSPVFDMNKKKDREAVGSLARKVSSSKTLLTGAIGDCVDKEKQRIAKANAAKKWVESELSDVRDQVLAPRKKWQEEQDRIEEERIAGIQARINNIHEIGNLDGTESKEHVASLIEALDAMVIDESFAELSADANKALHDTKTTLNDRFMRIIQDEQAAENERNLKEERQRSEIQTRLSNLMMMPAQFIGKPSTEIEAKINSLKGYTPSESEFLDRTDEAIQAQSAVIMQLEALAAQQKLVEDAQTVAEPVAINPEPVQETHINEQFVEETKAHDPVAAVVGNPHGKMGNMENLNHTSKPIERAETGHFTLDKSAADTKKHDLAVDKLVDVCGSVVGIDRAGADIIISMIEAGEIPYVSFNK